MGTSLVSIVIPAYNRPKMLAETLESIMAQTYSNFEIIVVDDGSPNDEVKKVCDTFSKVKYFRIDNSGGPSKPRNIGIKESKGKYIAFVDDDDLWLPKKLDAQVSGLENNPEYGLIHCCCSVIDVHRNNKDTIIGRPSDQSVKTGKVSVKMIGNWTLMTSSVLVRREIIDAVGMFNEQMPPAGEDTEFWVRCSFYTSFYYQDDPMVLYREHEGTSSLLSKKYIYVPKYLKKATKKALDDELITLSEYGIISKNIIRLQIKRVRLGFFKTLYFLFSLNPLWILNFGNIKLFINKVLKK